jgi:hypothetical protein
MSVARTRRRFTILDAMALIVATALGLMGYKFEGIDIFPVVKNNHGSWFAFLASLTISSLPLLSVWSLTLLLLRFRPPRPSLRALMRQPGIVACFMILTGVVFGLLMVSVIFAMTAAINTANGESVWSFFVDFQFNKLLAFLSSHTGCAIVASWVSLRLGRRWRPSPDWIDLTARFLGAIWIALSLFCGALYFFASN